MKISKTDRWRFEEQANRICEKFGVKEEVAWELLVSAVESGLVQEEIDMQIEHSIKSMSE